jgi:hypothetical protein
MPEDAPQLSALLGEQRELTREQMAAAWQLQVERVHEQLEAGWREQISRVMDERFAALEPVLEAETERRAAAVAERAGETARRQLSERLNQSLRRLELADTAEAWVSALMDGAHEFAATAILFRVQETKFQFEAGRMEGGEAPEALRTLEFPRAESPAMASVLEMQDTVIAMRTASELSLPLVQLLGEDAAQRVGLFPVWLGRASRDRHVIAILYAESSGAPLDVNVLEALTSAAGAVQECRVLAAKLTTASRPGGLMNIAPAAAAAAAAPAAPDPEWAVLSVEQQEAHLKAQRFARVRVAEMRLYLAAAVRTGRQNQNLYLSLRGEMDRGRAEFAHQFMNTPGMVDYFHREVVRTLANDNPVLLGPEYPGALA